MAKTSSRSGPAGRTPVYLEIGRTWVFAAALEWPGWCRRGKGEDGAIATLLDYGPRYGQVVGPGFAPGPLEVVGVVAGTSTTDFGAPDVPWTGDDRSWVDAEARRQLALLEACWRTFDAVVAAAPATLKKGPRGGGRDRDAIAQHVAEGERRWGAKVGARVRPRTPTDERRAALVAALGVDGPGRAWPARYALRRVAWHVLDHAWEIEDKSV